MTMLRPTRRERSHPQRLDWTRRTWCWVDNRKEKTNECRLIGCWTRSESSWR
jgi:hypothetical protein